MSIPSTAYFTKPVEIKDGRVVCPACECDFPLLQHRSYGSAAAKAWNTVPKFHRGFLSWWYSRQTQGDITLAPDFSEWYSKVELHALFCKESGSNINLNNFGDRLSGIKGMTYQVISVKKGVKNNKNSTIIDFYKLDMLKIVKLMSHEWNIIKTLEDIR